MKIHAIVFLVLIALSGSTARSQTRSEFKKIYEIDSKYVFRGVALEANFDRRGQICRLGLRSFDPESGRYQAEYPRVSGVIAQEILDRIDPENKRGEKTSKWGIAWFLGKVYVTPYEFEAIKVTTSGHIFPKSGSRSVANTNRIFTVEKGSMFPSAELITFEWKKRECK
jgi:hypothetical protein